MNKYFILLVLLLLSSPLQAKNFNAYYPLSAPLIPGNDFSPSIFVNMSLVINVKDAVTYELHLEGVHPLIGENITITQRRILPPIKNSKSSEAIEFIEILFKNATTIELRNIKRGKDFRILALLYVDGKSLYHILRDNGLYKNMWYQPTN